jgi:transposase InsO family protein
MDFVGPIHPPSNKKVYILVYTYYMTNWVEEKELIRGSEEAILAFLFEDIFIRFGVPRELVTDGGTPFTSYKFEAILSKYHVLHRIASPYHPQGNGQVESTNKVIEAILTKTMRENHSDWSDRLHEALWAYRTGFSPYELVYGKVPIFPIEFEIKTLRTASAVNLDLTMAEKARLQQLNELDEKHLDAIHQTTVIQKQRTKWHDRVLEKKLFQKGYWALLYDSCFK